MQNRVDPFGNIIDSKSRGQWMGNRGQLHNDTKNIVRPFKLKAWLTCLLSFKNRKRMIMDPWQYTELFFYDEATAFAGGHRPCFECRRQDYKKFKSYWLAGNKKYRFNEKTSIAEIDNILHKERIDSKGNKVTHFENSNNLPDGSFVLMNNDPYVVKNKHLYHWTINGYDKKINVPANVVLMVLTPASTLNAFRAGYTPQIGIDKTVE